MSLPPTAPRQEVRMFWTGPSLSLYEQLSLRSFVAGGAKVFLYSYDKDLIVPDGVELVDANEILPGPVHQFRKANGDSSLALHSDLFRYTALERFGGWYADLDMIFVGAALPDSRLYFASESEGVVNAAISKFPAHSAVMAAAVEESKRLLPETALAGTHEARLKIGPPLFTQLLRDYALDHLVLPRSRAYEIGYDEVTSLFDPAHGEKLLARIASSDFCHLWNEVWRWIRIPKNYGPPEGSFLDLMFRRFDVRFSPHARVSHGQVEDWFIEHQMLDVFRYHLRTERISSQKAGAIMRAVARGVEPENDAVLEKTPPVQHKLATHPQVVRTFWHGDVIGPYQLMYLRSFVDRGHRIEVFSYDLNLNAPDWIVVRNAADILPRERVLRPLGEEGRFAIHANLFRYALLHQLGGWWIDPDVLLLNADMPSEDIFLAGPDVFGLVPTGALKFPAGHPLLAEAIAQTELLGDSLEAWASAGSALLTTRVERHGLGESLQSRQPLGPVSWFEVPNLFDPANAGELHGKCNDFCFLQLHDEVWRRAGVPHDLAPPQGSFLYEMFVRHPVNPRFPAEISFSDLNRWIAHMYQCVRQQR